MEREPQVPLPHDDEDTSPEAIAERVRALYGIEKTSLEELIELANNEPGSERFDVFLDDLTYEALAENEDFNANRLAMTSGKLSADEQKELRDKQRGIFTQYRQAIIQEAGLPTESGMTEIEKSQQNIKRILEATLDGAEPTNPPQVLEALGIISHDEEGREIFTYPRGLFPPSTDRKWETYLETVRNHLRIERAVGNGTIDKSELGEADSTRRMAHNAASRDVQEILGLDKLEGSDWDFDKTRNMLAKMRDSRFPTVETAERAVTENAVIEGVIGMHALKALRLRLSDLHK